MQKPGEKGRPIEVTHNKRSEWYFAEIVLRYGDDSDLTSLVHINSVLISARSDSEAYDKSVLFGRGQERRYTNTEGRIVEVAFAGLRNLFYIYDGLHDGAELLYEEMQGLGAEEIERLVKRKEELAVFAGQMPR